jgi:hypothetical protein
MAEEAEVVGTAAAAVAAVVGGGVIVVVDNVVSVDHHVFAAVVVVAFVAQKMIMMMKQLHLKRNDHLHIDRADEGRCSGWMMMTTVNVQNYLDHRLRQT